MSPTASVFPPPVPSLPPSVSTMASTITSNTTEDSLGLDYQPLPKREKTSEELRVETLARQLVGTWSQEEPILLDFTFVIVEYIYIYIYMLILSRLDPDPFVVIPQRILPPLFYTGVAGFLTGTYLRGIWG